MPSLITTSRMRLPATAAELTDVWSAVTPAGISLDPDYGAIGNYGIETVQADASNAGHVYLYAHAQGIWKSTNYGLTWVGPINTGTNGSSITDGNGGITVVATGGAPTIYAGFIRGSTGLWKSTNGGVDWTEINLIPPLPSGRGDVYPVNPVDPYDSSHLLICGHEQDYILESFNGGTSWTSITMPTTTGGGTAFLFFINTGNAGTTADTWLWISQENGTYRTTNGGTSWTLVDDNSHPHGCSQIYQPDTSGVVFMAGAGSALGWGILRSTDYGATWAHVGPDSNKSIVWGTPTKMYGANGLAITDEMDPAFIVADQPGTGTWSALSNSPTWVKSGAHQVAVLYNGSNYIFVLAMGNGGVWRRVEA